MARSGTRFIDGSVFHFSDRDAGFVTMRATWSPSLVWRAASICGGVECVKFRLVIVLTAVAQKCIARTGRPGETLQVYSSYSAPPDVTPVCADTCVQFSYPVLGIFARNRRTLFLSTPRATASAQRSSVMAIQKIEHIALLVSQRFNRIEPRGLQGREEAGDDSDQGQDYK